MTDIHSQLQGELVQESNNNALLAAVTAERTRWQSDGLGSIKLFAIPAILLQVMALKQQLADDWDAASMRRLLFHGTSAVEDIINSVDGHGFLLFLLAVLARVEVDLAWWDTWCRLICCSVARGLFLWG